MPLLTTILLAALLIQLGAWLAIHLGVNRIRKDQPECKPQSDLPISVVVAARNEVENIARLLNCLQQQSHRPFEIVVVDDASTDGTGEVVGEAVRRSADGHSPEITLVRVTADERAAAALPPKKNALTRGIALAQHERLTFTDADCEPGPDWLSGIACQAAPSGSDEGALLIGYGPYKPTRGLLNTFIRYETFVMAMIAAAAVGLGRPFLAVGRNFSYTKSMFASVGGFNHSSESLSGDDDLFVQEVVRREAAPVRYILDERTFVPSAAPTSLRAWVRQKRRHQSAGRHYPAVAVGLLAVFHASNLVLWLGVPGTIIVLGNWHGAGLLALKLLGQRAFTRQAEDSLNAREITVFQPALDGLYALYQVLAGVLSLLPTPRRW
ncbi:glycosyltransferase [soil metagenome]